MIKSHKRGRPKGSKNKSTLLKEAAEKLVKKDEAPPKPPPKAFKYLGYCKCGSMIGSTDLETKFVYICPHCNLRARTNSLKKKQDSEVYSSKKDYMERIVNHEHLDSVPLSDDLDIKDVQVKE